MVPSLLPINWNNQYDWFQYEYLNVDIRRKEFLGITILLMKSMKYVMSHWDMAVVVMRVNEMNGCYRIDILLAKWIMGHYSYSRSDREKKEYNIYKLFGVEYL